MRKYFARHTTEIELRTFEVVSVEPESFVKVQTAQGFHTIALKPNETLKPGDLIWYDVSEDEMKKFCPESYPNIFYQEE